MSPLELLPSSVPVVAELLTSDEDVVDAGESLVELPTPVLATSSPVDDEMGPAAVVLLVEEPVVFSVDAPSHPRARARAMRRTMCVRAKGTLLEP